MQLAINKKQSYFSLSGHQLADNLILVVGLEGQKMKGQIMNESELVTIAGIIVTIIFKSKSFSDSL